MIVNDSKILFNFLKENGLDFKYWKEADGLYDIHIFNLRLVNFSFADFDDLFEANFIIDSDDSKFLHIFRLDSYIRISIGKLDSHTDIKLKNAKLTYDKIEGLEILWREDK